MTRSRVIALGAFLCFFVLSPMDGLRAQGLKGVNPEGYILSNGWLALGPFSNEYGCTALNNDFLLPFLAPSLIQYLTPEKDDEIDYDRKRAESTLYSYVGPEERPVWRLFQNTEKPENRNLDFQEDSSSVGGPADNAMTFVVTYFEFLGDNDATVDLCLGSDDGIQVWLDTELLHNLNTCRDEMPCQDLITIEVSPGNHRIVLGVWDSSQEWTGSLGFFRPDPDRILIPITDGDHDWRFLGTKRPLGFSLSNTGFVQREIKSAQDISMCPLTLGSGPLIVTLKAQLPDGPNIPLLQEFISGPMNSQKITIEASTIPDPELTSRLPLSAVLLGEFADSQVLVNFPRCPAGNGSAIVDDGGTPGTPGDDTYTLANTGWSVWQSGDNCTFAYNRVEGDFELIARIAEKNFVPHSRYGQIGLMARQDLSNRSRYAVVQDFGEDPQDSNDFESRSTQGGRDNFLAAVLAPFTHHEWLKLRRSGDEFEGFSAPSSPDGSAGPWTWLGSNCWSHAPPEVLVGIFVSSSTGNCNQGQAIGKFDQVILAGKKVDIGNDIPLGVEITWRNITRSALREGLSYSFFLDHQNGVALFDGTAVDDRGFRFPILGDGEGTPLPPIKDYGPFADPEFFHGHSIGMYPTKDSAASLSPGMLTINAAGARFDYHYDYFGGDKCFYVYREIGGDFSARVTVADRMLPSSAPWASYGIMARQDCSAQARFSFSQDVGLGPQGGSTFDGRRANGGLLNFNGIFAQYPFPGQHANTLRLDRCGNVFNGYVLSEPDPTDPTKGTFGGSPGQWVLLGEEDWMDDAPPSVFIGLAVTSHLNCEMATITFENWRLYPACGQPPEPRFVRGDADSDGQVSLTDVIRILGYLFLAEPAPECMDAADADDSGFGQLDLTDPIVILGWLFLDDPAPPPPSPTQADYTGADCAVDPTPDDGMDCHLPAGKCN